MRSCFVVFILVFSAADIVSSECSVKQVANCFGREMVDKIYPHEELAETTYEEVCGKVNETIVCMGNLTDCPPIAMKAKDFQRAFLEPAVSICSDVSYHEKLQEDLKCLAENKTHFQNCEFKVESHKLTEQIFEKAVCAMQEAKMKCYIAIGEDMCAENGMKLLLNLFERNEQLLNKHCDPKISIADTAFRNEPLPSAVFSVLILLLLKCSM